MGSSSSHCQHGRLLKHAPCMHRRWHSLSSEKGKQTMLFGVLEQRKDQGRGISNSNITADGTSFLIYLMLAASVSFQRKALST